jgi:hypothetical protein
MTQPTLLRPTQHLRQVAQAYPGLWPQVDRWRAQRGPSRTWQPYSRADQMGPLAAGPGGRWRTSAPRLRISRHASTVARTVAPILWRAIVPASKRQAGHGRSRTHVQFLSSGLGGSMGWV